MTARSTTDGALRRLEDLLEQNADDLIDLDAQETAGELDAVTAERLRATYHRERRTLREQIDELATTTVEPAGRDRRRVLAGVVLVLVGMAAVTGLLLVTVDDRRPGELATGGIAGEVASGEMDLSEVTNEEMEAVVAENPGVTGMRLALARRYFEAGEFEAALPHFMEILEGPEPDNAEALASVGWMTHLSGEPEVGARFVERAIEVAPDYAQAHWFLANIRFEGLDDPAGAVAPLERLLDHDAVPDEIRDRAETLLERATEGR